MVEHAYQVHQYIPGINFGATFFTRVLHEKHKLSSFFKTEICVSRHMIVKSPARNATIVVGVTYFINSGLLY